MPRYIVPVEVEAPSADEAQEGLHQLIDASRPTVTFNVADALEPRPVDDDDLGFVNVVEVEGREKPYVFGGRSLSDRFAAFVNHGCEPDDDHPAFQYESPINVGAAAESLIAAQRAGVLEHRGFTSVADEIQDGTPPAVVADRIKETAKAFGDLDFSAVLPLLQCWADEDVKTRVDPELTPEEVRRQEAEEWDDSSRGVAEEDAKGGEREVQSEPAYTIVGTHGERGAPYTVTVYTHNGPDAALTLAHAAYAERVSAHAGEQDPPELQPVAIFGGEPRLIDFDQPETGPKGGNG